MDGKVVKSRKAQAQELFEMQKKDFLCPECSENLVLDSSGSFRCKNGHCFDLSSKGYVNFIPGQKPVNYSRELFEYRQKVLEDGFYMELVQVLRELVAKRADQPEKLVVLDVGCGEGYYSRQLREDPRLKESCTFFAMDLAKDAIRMAAKDNRDIGFIVADLAHLPFKRKRVDVLLNILTPANYEEFFRIMKPGGLLIKVIPGRDYLREVRAAVSGQLVNKDYSNREVISYFKKHAKLVDQKTVRIELPVDGEQAEAFLRMTPMTGQVDLSQVDSRRLQTITIHLEVLTGMQK